MSQICDYPGIRLTATTYTEKHAEPTNKDYINFVTYSAKKSCLPVETVGVANLRVERVGVAGWPIEIVRVAGIPVERPVTYLPEERAVAALPVETVGVAALPVELVGVA